MHLKLDIKESISTIEVIFSYIVLSIGYFFEWIKTFWPLIFSVSSIVFTFALLYYLWNLQPKNDQKRRFTSLIMLLRRRWIAYPLAVMCISWICPSINYLYHYSEIQERKRKSLEAMATYVCIESSQHDAEFLSNIRNGCVISIDNITLSKTCLETVLSVNNLYLGDYEKAYAGLEKSALENNATAMYYLSWALYLGLGREPDIVRSHYYLEEAAKNENILAQIYMAKSYILSIGTSFDAQKVEYWYSRAIANNSNSRNELYVASAYFELLDWYIATNQNDKFYEACEDCPKFLKKGRLFEMLQQYRIIACWKTERWNKAQRIAHKEVRKKNPWCFSYLGAIYEFGINKNKDLAKAERIYLYAAKYLKTDRSYDDLIRLYKDNGKSTEAEFWIKVKNSGI